MYFVEISSLRRIDYSTVQWFEWIYLVSAKSRLDAQSLDKIRQRRPRRLVIHVWFYLYKWIYLYFDFLTITFDLLKFHQRKTWKKNYLLFRNFSKITFSIQINGRFGIAIYQSRLFLLWSIKTSFLIKKYPYIVCLDHYFSTNSLLNLVDWKLGTKFHQDHLVSTLVQVEEIARIISNFHNKHPSFFFLMRLKRDFKLCAKN